MSDLKLEKTILKKIERISSYNYKFNNLKETDLKKQIPCQIVITNDWLSKKLTKEEIDYLIKNSDLKHCDIAGCDCLMLVLPNNQYKNLNLDNEIINYLIKNSDLKHTTVNGWNSLMLALFYDHDQNLNLNQEQWQYLVENSDLLTQNNGRTLSVIGFCIKHKPELIEVVLEKVIKNKKFNLKNYRTDENYQEISKWLKIFKIKKNIENNIKKIKNKNITKI